MLNKDVMKYILRSLKYLVVLCVLYVAMVWLKLVTEPMPISLWEAVSAYLSTDRGRLMLVCFVILAAIYPLFGFMRSRVADCSIVADRVRIDNAMHVYGFKLVEEREGALVYRAVGIVQRLWFIFEDRVEVRAVDGGVELYGVRRAVARITFQLKAYVANRRYETIDNE